MHIWVSDAMYVCSSVRHGRLLRLIIVGQGLTTLTGLRRLGISGTVAGGDALLSLAATLPALRHLEMRNAQLSDTDLLRLPTVRPFGLGKLCLAHVCCRSSSPACIQCINEEFLDPGLASEAAAINDAQAAPHLARLDISGAWLSASGLAALRQLRRLEALSMDGTVQPAADTHYLAPLTRLTELQVLGVPSSEQSSCDYSPRTRTAP